MEAKTMRTTQKNLDALAARINTATGSPLAGYDRETGAFIVGHYRAGQIFGLRWSLARVSNTGGGMQGILSASTKGELYELMTAWLAGFEAGRA